MTELRHKQYLIMKLKIALKKGDLSLIKLVEDELLALVKVEKTKI